MTVSQEPLRPDDRRHIGKICQGLKDWGIGMPFIAQIERVVCRIGHPCSLREAGSFSDIFAIFRSRALVPAVLLERFGESPRAQARAVCFAACIYPNRAFSLQERLGPRIASFESALCSPLGPIDQWRQKYPHDLDEQEMRQFLDDLCAARYVVCDTPSEREALQEERRVSAALYLLTCLPETIETILANWRDDAQLVRYIRQFLPSCPSETAGRENVRESQVDWDQVEHDLARQAQPVPAQIAGRAISLEKHIQRQARQRPLLLERQPLPWVVSQCWGEHWDKLVSGFPYYAFRSHLARWWRQCVGNWLLRGQFDSPDLDTLRPHEYRVTEEELLFFREGYRLVRASFCARGKNADNESVRRIVDALWSHRLEPKIEGDAPEAVTDIYRELTEDDEETVTTANLNNLSHGLNRRMWAYTLARWRRLSNEQILNIRLVTDKGREERPFQDRRSRAGVLTVASLARMVPRQYSLLWVFTANRYLRERVDPQHPEPWSVMGYLRELWYWLTWDLMTGIGRAAKDWWDPVSMEALPRMVEKPISSLLAGLASVELPDEVQSYLERVDVQQLIPVAQSRALACCQRLMGSHGWRQHAGNPFSQWRKMAPSHWIVPVWYLTVMERLKERRLLERLQVSADERQQVIDLHRDIARSIGVLTDEEV